MSPRLEKQEAEIMSENPLLEVRRLGQSVWLDDIRRGWLESGELKRLIDEDGLAGVTSNPSIFHKAIGGSRDYDEAIRVLASQGRNIRGFDRGGRRPGRGPAASHV